MKPDSERVAYLKRLLAAREGKAEYKKNCETIRAELAHLASAVEIAEES